MTENYTIFYIEYSINIVLDRIMPIGMFFWMVDMALTMQSPQAIVYNLMWFVFTAMISFVIIWVLVYPGIYFFVLRTNPFRLYYNIMPALVVAFGSASR